MTPRSPSRDRFAEVVRNDPVDIGLACLLIGCEADPDLDVEASLRVLDTLAATVRAQVPPGRSPTAAAEGLRRALGEQGGFAGGSYDDLRSSLLHEVLRRRRGLPLLLSVVWLEVAKRLGLRAYAVGLPGHVIVGIGDPAGEHVLVDPFSGGRVVDRELLTGPDGRPPRPELFVPLPPVDLLLRLLNNVRALTGRQPRTLPTAATRLWAVQLSLLLPRHPVQLRREQGELLVRLGDHLAGAQELETYALVVADAEEKAHARRAARLARAQLN